jgi:hypothetical protein
MITELVTYILLTWPIANVNRKQRKLLYSSKEEKKKFLQRLDLWISVAFLRNSSKLFSR